MKDEEEIGVLEQVGRAAGKTVGYLSENAKKRQAEREAGNQALREGLGDIASGYKAGRGEVLPEAAPGEPVDGGLNAAGVPNYLSNETLPDARPGQDAIPDPAAVAATAVPQVEDDNNAPPSPIAPKPDDAIDAHLRNVSQPAGPDVNAGNLQDITNSDGIKYAGKYGNTDVLASVTTDAQGREVTNFSDRANLDTLRGGAPAELPDNGNPVIAGDDTMVPSSGGVSSSTSQKLHEARMAAVRRGDLDAVDRSMMTADERRRRDLEDDARDQDPLGALKQEDMNRAKLDELDLAKKTLEIEREMQLDANQYEYMRSVNEDRRKAITDSFESIKKEYDEQGIEFDADTANALRDAVFKAGTEHIDQPSIIAKAKAILERDNSDATVEVGSNVSGSVADRISDATVRALP